MANSATATPIRAPRAQSSNSTPIEAAHAVFGQRPWDVLSTVNVATDALGWLEAIFDAINVMHDKPCGYVQIKRLSGVAASRRFARSRRLSCQRSDSTSG